MPSKAFKLAEAMVSNPVMSDMVENPTATPTQISAVETKTSAISDTGVISVNTKNIVSNNVLTQSFDSNQVVGFNLTDSINTVSPIVSVFKEVPQQGFSSKGQWDVNANATNYDFYDEKPISYASSTLTPSATGDGTFTSSSMIIGPTDIDNLTYDNKSINITSLNHTGTGTYGDLKGFYIKPDGTKLFSLSTAGIVSEHVLSTAYDISTTTYNNVDTSALTTETSAAFDTNLALSPDGTKLFVLQSATKEIARYDLSTAWDLSTLSTTKHSYYIEAANLNTPISFTFNADGTVLIIFYNSTDAIVKYDLSTAWDLSTASRDSSFTIVANSASSTAYVGSTSGIDLHSLEFTNNGNVLLGSDYAQQKIYQWNLTSPYSITSTSLVYDTQFSITLLAGNNVSYGPGPLRVLNGKAYIVDGGTKSIIYQYISSASNVFNASDVGKKVVGNSGSAIITSAAGAYKSVTAFADTSAISSWQLFSAEGKANGSGITLSGFSNAYNLNLASYDNKNYATSLTSASGVAFSSDGTKMYLNGFNTAADQSTNQHIWQYSLSTAWDVTTASYDNISLNTSAQNTRQRDLRFKPDGTVLYMVGSTPDGVWQYDLSTAWDLSTASYSNKTISVGSQDTNPAALALSPDGTKVYVAGYSSKIIFQYDLSTAWDLSNSTYWGWNYNRTTSGDVYSTSAIDSMEINSSGTKLYVAVAAAPSDVIIEYDLPSNGKISDITYSDHYSQWTTLGGAGVDLKGIAFSSSGDKFYTFGTNDYKVYEFSVGSTSLPYSQYSPALTNSSNGQINSSAWQDINSMTADETKNGGDIFYAVSTDNRTSWGVAKGSDGVRKIAKNNSGTWQYNNNAGTSVPILTGTVYANKSKDISAEGTQPFGIFIKPDGSKLYVVQSQSTGVRGVFQYTLSTAFDISTASYDNKTFSLVSAMATNNNDPLSSITINSDGSKFYCGSYNGGVMEFTMSTAWDISTGAYNNVLVNPLNALGTELITIGKNDTRIYIGSRRNDRIREYPLSTAGDLSTIGSWLDEVRFDQAPTVEGSTIGVAFNNTGTKLYFAGYGTDAIHQYSLSTPWDLSTINKDGISVSVTSQTTDPVAFCYTDNGTFYVVGFSVPAIYQYTAGTESEYGTSETWVNGTNNNEHATLQEALTSQAFNRMNKAQLDAVADNYHFSQDSADTLDLMIAPYAASGTSPISDGVTINYDAAALVREAIPGADYIAEFPNNTTINIKSLVNANMKVRAL